MTVDERRSLVYAAAMVNYVKCRSCGWVHFAVSAECARAEVADANAELRSRGKPEAASFERYLCCFRCGQDSANFEPALDTDGPTGVTVQGVVVER